MAWKNFERIDITFGDNIYIDLRDIGMISKVKSNKSLGHVEQSERRLLRLYMGGDEV